LKSIAQMSVKYDYDIKPIDNKISYDVLLFHGIRSKAENWATDIVNNGPFPANVIVPQS